MQNDDFITENSNYFLNPRGDQSRDLLVTNHAAPTLVRPLPEGVRGAGLARVAFKLRNLAAQQQQVNDENNGHAP